MRVRTKADVLREFGLRGISISAWAKSKGFSAPLVYQVIAGKKIGLRGQCHQIAVALGLKEGLVGGLNDLPFDRLQLPANSTLENAVERPQADAKPLRDNETTPPTERAAPLIS